MEYDDDGRFLIVSPRVMIDGRAMRKVTVVRGFELPQAFADGWEVVVEDPFPHQFAPWARDDEDPA